MKIAIIDTVGATVPGPLRAMLAGLDLYGFEPPPRRGESNGAIPDPHGVMCGFFVGLPILGAGKRATIHFLRNFNSDGRPITGADEWALEMIEKEKYDYVSCSWGMADADDQILNIIGPEMWKAFVARFREIAAAQPFYCSFASGNADKNDPDRDTCWPARSMPDLVRLIAAHDRRGVPAPWSSDGPGVRCAYWAHRVLAPRVDGKLVPVSGTSFACPKDVGLAAALGLSQEQMERFTVAGARRPEPPPSGPPWTVPHPKWGYGSMEHEWQALAARVYPTIVGGASRQPTYMHDFRRCNRWWWGWRGAKSV